MSNQHCSFRPGHVIVPTSRPAGFLFLPNSTERVVIRAVKGGAVITHYSSRKLKPQSLHAGMVPSCRCIEISIYNPWSVAWIKSFWTYRQHTSKRTTYLLQHRIQTRKGAFPYSLYLSLLIRSEGLVRPPPRPNRVFFHRSIPKEAASYLLLTSLHQDPGRLDFMMNHPNYCDEVVGL